MDYDRYAAIPVHYKLCGRPSSLRHHNLRFYCWLCNICTAHVRAGSQMLTAAIVLIRLFPGIRWIHTRHEPNLTQRWANVCDVNPTLSQIWLRFRAYWEIRTAGIFQFSLISTGTKCNCFRRRRCQSGILSGTHRRTPDNSSWIRAAAIYRRAVIGCDLHLLQSHI